MLLLNHYQHYNLVKIIIIKVFRSNINQLESKKFMKSFLFY